MDTDVWEVFDLTQTEALVHGGPWEIGPIQTQAISLLKTLVVPASSLLTAS